MFFSGSTQQRKVSLGGRSRGEETREQTLERTRAEREKRQRSKLENKSAVIIASAWRQRAAAIRVQNDLRQSWVHLCRGSQDSRQALQQLFAEDSRALPGLLFCYDRHQAADREALAAACRLLTSTAVSGACPLLAEAAVGAAQPAGLSRTSAGLAAAATAVTAPTQEQLALFRVQKLVLLALSTLAAGGPEAAAALSIPYAALNSPQQQQQPLAPLVDILIKVVNPDTWQASVQAAMKQQPQQQEQEQDSAAVAKAAAAGAEAVLRHLFRKELMVHLRMLLLALPAPRGPPTKTCAEVCVTQMVVRALKLQLLPIKHQQHQQQQQLQQQPLLAASAAADAAPPSPTTAASPPHAPAAAAAAGSALQLGASQLLCVPGLWTKAPSLAPVVGRLCGLVLGELGQLHSSRQLTDALLQCAAAQASSSASSSSSRQTPVPTGAAAAAVADAAAVAVAALAENFVEAAAAGTLFRGLGPAEQVATAGKLVGFLVLLLEAARQLSALQRRHWRAKLSKHSQRQQQGTGRSIYDTQGAGAGGAGRKAGYVPGAGFVASKGAAAAAAGAAAAADDMEVDAPGKAAPAAAAAAAGGTADGGAAMDVYNPSAPTQQPSPAAAAEADGGAAKLRKAAAADAAVIEQPVAASAWSAEAPSDSSKPSEVTASESCMQLLAGSTKGLQLLRLLVATLLPATTAAEARALRQQQQQPAGPTSPAAAAAAAAAVLTPGCAVQQQLLELIWGLSQAPAYRQKVWLGLGVGARLVPRLWYSLVLPLHLSTPGGMLYYTGNTAASSSSSSSGRFSSSGSPGPADPGSSQLAAAAGGAGSWVLPMLVLCQAFNAALSFTHVEDFYAAEGAPGLVPLTQLYDAAAPAAGLVMLVKAAVWQILWSNSVSPPGLPSPPPAAQQHQQQLKAAVAEVCGLLLCQLHDRNCLRPFCPSGAFLCDLATAAPARLQAEVAAAAARMGAQADGSDEEGGGADDSAWQQQQQWQQQRQQGLGPLAAVATAGGDGDSDGGGFGSRDSSSGGGAVAAAGAATDGDGAQGADGSSMAARGEGGGRSPGSRVWVVLEHAPCLVPFELRVQLLQHVLELEKASAVEAGEVMHMWDDPMEPPQNRFVTIRREDLMEDGFSQIGRMDPDRVKGRLRIQYVNEAGLPEAGIDGGGLFKDFMEELLRQGFSPQSHLMAENPQHQLYPSPGAFAKFPDAEHRLRFLGRMLGKCLYEGMLLELPLAAFFLKKMRGGVCDINDLPSLDPEVYKHLLQLRHYPGDFSELSLTFTATVVEPLGPHSTTTSSSSSSSGRQREVELKPGGRDLPVRSDNVIEYIHRLADFRLNRQMDRAAAAFLRGFFELIKPRWVRMFNEAELQMLISGSEEGVDVDDLMKHINYAGGYHEEHPVIITLWETLRGFTPQQQRQFLKFVTSCSRAPLLGFAYLEPQVCVQMSGGMLQAGATQRLPTAATCMNLLKLPPYRTVKEMREKLLYAISAGAGFELS